MIYINESTYQHQSQGSKKSFNSSALQLLFRRLWQAEEGGICSRKILICTIIMTRFPPQQNLSKIDNKMCQQNTFLRSHLSVPEVTPLFEDSTILRPRPLLKASPSWGRFFSSQAMRMQQPTSLITAYIHRDHFPYCTGYWKESFSLIENIVTLCK